MCNCLSESGTSIIMGGSADKQGDVFGTELKKLPVASACAGATGSYWFTCCWLIVAS